jgi:excisionase family DNA binding protein
MHAPALTLKDFCDAYRVCRETAYQQIRAGRLRAVKLGRKTLILRADAEVWAASLPELGSLHVRPARSIFSNALNFCRSAIAPLVRSP